MPPLTSAQERRARTFVEDWFVTLDQLYNKRNEPGAKLHSLVDYIDFIQPVHEFILHIPPDPATTRMRASFYLRLTLDLFERSITYPLFPPGHKSPSQEQEDKTLVRFLDCLVQFDEGWLAILTSRSWDSKLHKSIPSEHPRPPSTAAQALDSTTKTVLHSAILSGIGAIDDWLCEHPEVRASTREKFGESFWKALEVLEGVEEGEEGFADSDLELGIPSISGEMDVDDDADPGMFHGFDDL